jgi:uncharacterized protein YggE
MKGRPEASGPSFALGAHKTGPVAPENALMHRIGTPLLIAPLALVALAGLALPALAQPVVSQQRTLTVSGEGEIKVVADEAILTAGVQTQAATAGEAVAANRRAMNDVFAELKRQGIPDKSIQTSAFNVFPQFDNGKEGSAPHIAGYQASNSVSVIVDDLTKLGPAIDALVASGANSMAGIDFMIRDSKPLLRQAREAAIRDAIDRAQIYAKAAGLSLGHITQIQEGMTQIPRPVFRSIALMGVNQPPPTPVAAGEETVSAQVTVTFEIK